MKIDLLLSNCLFCVYIFRVNIWIEKWRWPVQSNYIWTFYNTKVRAMNFALLRKQMIGVHIMVKLRYPQP